MTRRCNTKASSIKHKLSESVLLVAEIIGNHKRHKPMPQDDIFFYDTPESIELSYHSEQDNTSEGGYEKEVETDPYNVLRTMNSSFDTDQACFDNNIRQGLENSDCHFTIPKNKVPFTGSNMTLVMFVLSVVSICNGAQMSKSMIEKLLVFLSLLLSPIIDVECKFPVTAEEFFSLVSEFRFKEHKYCMTCENEVANIEGTICSECGSNLKRYYTQEIEEWFIQTGKTVGAQKWLELLMMGITKDDFHNQQAPEKIKDYKDGLEFRRLNRIFPIDSTVENDIVLHTELLCDGGKMFKSSNQSFYPGLLVVYNLPACIRYCLDFMMVFLFTDHKPLFSIVMRPIIENFKKTRQRIALYMDKRIVQLRSVLATVTTDRMLYDLAGIIAPTGYNSCNICDQHGVRFNDRTVFPLFQHHKLRTMDSWERAMNSGKKKTMGVTGISILTELDYIDMTKVFTAEILHDFNIGFLKKVLKRIRLAIGTEEWNLFNDSYEKQRYPSMFHRQPSKIHVTKQKKEITGVKAIQYWNIFIYMFPLFYPHTNHITYKNRHGESKTMYDYISNISKFGNMVINPISLDGIEQLFDLVFEILWDTEVLFGRELLTLVSHRLIHYPYLILWHGPVYLNSAFPMERSIHDFLDTITGTNYIERKCLHSMLVKQKLKYYNRTTGESKQTFSIGNSEFVYCSEGFAKVEHHKTTSGITLHYCSHVVIYPLQTKGSKYYEKFPLDCVPCFALTLESCTILVPTHKNVSFFV